MLMEEYWHVHNSTVVLDYNGALFTTATVDIDQRALCDVVATPQPEGGARMCNTLLHSCPVPPVPCPVWPHLIDTLVVRLLRR